MARASEADHARDASLCFNYSLVFFLLVFLFSCKNHSKNITLVWKDKRATGIQIPAYFVRDISGIQAKHSLRVVLSNRNKGESILGNFVINRDEVVFEPLIPLSPGLSYDIFKGTAFIGSIRVPLNTAEKPPVLISVYPESDTLPENLLKIYLRFSKPMRTGQALDHIYLSDRNRDTMNYVFLNLQPELWDTSGTVLTLWLDPGRIKRDLVLNRKLGNPLKRSEVYQLIVSRQWKDTYGVSLSKDYTKQFRAGERDSRVPDINGWQLDIPKAGTRTPLLINTHESLDHYLFQESIRILNTAGTGIKGTVHTGARDRLWKFIPAEPWKKQLYKIQVDARLEDLAGNNLNRVFDRDITRDIKKDKAYYERNFEILK